MAAGAIMIWASFGFRIRAAVRLRGLGAALGVEGRAGNRQGVAGSKADGLEARREIARKTADPGSSYEYLTRYIRYDLGEKEKEAILLFRELALRHGLLARTAELDFV